MPNYEYQCKACEHQFEIWQEVGEAAPPCPECGSAVKKIFHPPRVHFKGSGFYITDLRAEKDKKASGKAKSEAKDEAAAPATGEAKSESSGEAKSDAKGETKTADKTEGKAATAAV